MWNVQRRVTCLQQEQTLAHNNDAYHIDLAITAELVPLVGAESGAPERDVLLLLRRLQWLLLVACCRSGCRLVGDAVQFVALPVDEEEVDGALRGDQVDEVDPFEAERRVEEARDDAVDGELRVHEVQVALALRPKGEHKAWT